MKRLAQKSHNEKVWYVDTTKPIVIQVSVHITDYFVSILAKFHCFWKLISTGA